MEVNLISEVLFIDYPNYLDGVGYMLLWIEGLAVALLFVATVCALATCLKKPLWRRVVAGVTALLPLAAGGFVTLIGWILLSGNMQPGWFFAYSLVWVLTYAAACLMLLKRSGIFQAEASSSGSWPCTRLAAALGIVLAIWIGTFGIMDASVKASLASQQTHASIRGLTILPAPIPDDQNAYFAYEKAYHAMGSREKFPEWFRDVNKANFNPATEKVRIFLAGQLKALALTRAAVAMNDYYFHHDLDFMSPNPQILGYTYLARLLALDARSRAEAGDFTGALKNISAIHDMALHTARPPLLISTFVAVGLHQIAVSTLEQVLARNTLMPDGVQSSFASTYGNLLYDAFRKSIMVEGAMVQSALTHDLVIGRKIAGGEPLFGPLISVYRIFFAPYDMAFQDSFWRKQSRLYEKSIHEAIAGLDGFEKEMEKGSILSSVATVSFSRYVEQIAEAQAMLHAADIGIAAAIYRKGHRRYPESFDDLVPDYLPEVPADPFDGGPMRMKVINNGLIIYSVGNNRKDDGGMDYDIYKKTGDVSFYLGEAYTEHRLKPAILEEKKRKVKRRTGK